MNSVMFPFRSLCEAFQQRVAADASTIALRTPDGRVEISWGSTRRGCAQSPRVWPRSVSAAATPSG